MNKKGQVLVMFVLLLPILFLGIYYTYIKIDLYIEEKNQDKIIDKLCNYYFKTLDYNKTIELGTKQDDTQTIEITLEKEEVKITLLKEKTLLNKKNRIETTKICKKG